MSHYDQQSAYACSQLLKGPETKIMLPNWNMKTSDMMFDKTIDENKDWETVTNE